MLQRAENMCVCFLNSTNMNTTVGEFVRALLFINYLLISYANSKRNFNSCEFSRAHLTCSLSTWWYGSKFAHVENQPNRTLTDSEIHFKVLVFHHYFLKLRSSSWERENFILKREWQKTNYDVTLIRFVRHFSERLCGKMKRKDSIVFICARQMKNEKKENRNQNNSEGNQHKKNWQNEEKQRNNLDRMQTMFISIYDHLGQCEKFHRRTRERKMKKKSLDENKKPVRNSSFHNVSDVCISSFVFRLVTSFLWWYTLFWVRAQDQHSLLPFVWSGFRSSFPSLLLSLSVCASLMNKMKNTNTRIHLPTNIYDDCSPCWAFKKM